MRWVTCVIAAAVMVVSLPFAGMTASPVVITSWNGVGPPENVILSQFTRDFNTKYAGQIQVTENVTKWDTLYSQILTDYRSGNPPDVLTFETSALPQYVHFGVLQPVGPLMAQAGLKQSDFVPAVWRSTFIGGVQYAVPLDVHPWGFFYNRKLFQAAGLPDRAPRNMAEFLSDAQKLTVAGTGGAPDQYGFGFNYNGANPSRLMISLLAQKGKTILSPDNKRAVFDTADTREVLQFLYDLVYKYKVVPQRETDAVGDFKRGAIAMLVTGPWEIPDFKSVSGLDFATAAMPVFYNKPGVWGDAHDLVLSKTNSPERQKAAMEFAAYISSRGYEWTTQAGHLPVREDVINNPQFKTLGYWQPLVAEESYMTVYPPIDQFSEMFGQDPTAPFVKMTESILLNQASIAAAVTQAQTEFNQVLAQK